MPWPLIIFIAAILVATIIGAAACRAILYEFRDAVHRSPLCGACGYSRTRIPDWQPCPECGVDRPDALERRLVRRPWRVRWVVVPMGLIALLALVSAMFDVWSALGWGMLAMTPYAAALFVDRRARVSRDRTYSLVFITIPLAIALAAQVAMLFMSNIFLWRIAAVPTVGAAAAATLTNAQSLGRLWMAAGLIGGAATIGIGFWQAIAAFFAYAGMDRESGGPH